MKGDLCRAGCLWPVGGATRLLKGEGWRRGGREGTRGGGRGEGVGDKGRGEEGQDTGRRRGGGRGEAQQPSQTPQLGERSSSGARLASPASSHRLCPSANAEAHSPHDGHTDHPSLPRVQAVLLPLLPLLSVLFKTTKINASKTHQAIPSQTLERKGLPSVLFSLPPALILALGHSHGPPLCPPFSRL